MSEQHSSQEMSHAVSNDENQASTSAFVPDNSQAPTRILSSSRSDHSQGILLWNILQLPPIRASERLKEVMDPKKVVDAMRDIAMVQKERAFTKDEEGFTQLMCLLSNPEEFAKKKEYLVPLVESLKDNPVMLEMKNEHGGNALYFAAINFPEMPYVCGYLGAVMMQKGIYINKPLDRYNNTLLHCIAARGDSHAEVLAEILSLLHTRPNIYISGRNTSGQTALHIAVQQHRNNPSGNDSLDITRILLENGAVLWRWDNVHAETPLHLAVWMHCDPWLVKVLLQFANSEIVNQPNIMGNTALHLAANMPKIVDLYKQKEVCRLLIEAGALTNVQNREAKTPLDLVVFERKEIIKKILYRLNY